MGAGCGVRPPTVRGAKGGIRVYGVAVLVGEGGTVEQAAIPVETPCLVPVAVVPAEGQKEVVVGSRNVEGG